MRRNAALNSAGILFVLLAAQCATLPADSRPDGSRWSPPPARQVPAPEAVQVEPDDPEAPPPEDEQEDRDDQGDEEYKWGEARRPDEEEGFNFSDLRPEEDDQTRTAAGALSLFMRARNYRTILLLKSVMTAGLEASYDHDSARFNGKQNVRIAAFHFKEEDFRPIRYSGSGSSREATIYDAVVDSLWAAQGEVVETRKERIRLVREDSGVWRAARLDILEANRHRYNETIPALTSLRKVLRAWYRRNVEMAEPYLSEKFIRSRQNGTLTLEDLFVGDPAVRHSGFRIHEILWDENSPDATAQVDLYYTARDRFGSLEPATQRIDLVLEGVAWLIDVWKEMPRNDS